MLDRELNSRPWDGGGGGRDRLYVKQGIQCQYHNVNWVGKATMT